MTEPARLTSDWQRDILQYPDKNFDMRYPGLQKAIDAALARLDWCERELAHAHALLADLDHDVSGATEAVYRVREREACAEMVEQTAEAARGFGGVGNFHIETAMRNLARVIRTSGPTLSDDVARERDTMRAALEEIVRLLGDHRGWNMGEQMADVARKALAGEVTV